jgi:hypothetical protein
VRLPETVTLPGLTSSVAARQQPTNCGYCGAKRKLHAYRSLIQLDFTFLAVEDESKRLPTCREEPDTISITSRLLICFDRNRQMSLLTTRMGIDWLSQFEEADKEMAQVLVNSLQLISFDKFEAGMIRLISALVSTGPLPLALYCIRETQPGERYFRTDSRDSVPSPGPLEGEVGSEGRLAHIVTNLCRTHGNICLNHPGLAELRRRRCCSIALLDDISGSGDRVQEFLQSFYRHPTIKSWYSYRKIDFHIVCYAVSEKAEKIVRVPRFFVRNVPSKNR